MNFTMISHTKSKEAFIKIFDLFKGISERERQANKEIEEIKKNQFYSDEGKKNAIQSINKKFIDYTILNSEQIIKNYDDIIAFEQENAQIFDINNPELQGAISLFVAMGTKTTLTTIRQILKPLKGDKQSLNALKPVFDNLGLNTYYLNEINVNVDEVVKGLKKDVVNIKSANPKTNLILKIYKESLELADKLGIEFTEEEKDINIDIVDFLVDNARIGAGL